MAVMALSIEGGVNTELGPSAPHRTLGVLPDGTIRVSVPWLVRANNIAYTLDGWFEKMRGASNVNATATGTTDTVAGIFDYWRSTASGTPTQQRVCISGTQFYTESGGTLTSQATGLPADVRWAFEVMNDALVIADSDATSVPRQWNQTTFANLGGSPPNFSFMVEHRGRMWAAGVDTNKSRLYYTVLDTYNDWTGAGSGSIDVAPDDGDVLTGLRSHKGRLLVFKGPYRGSIHQITGSAPTGTDAFARVPLNEGVGSTSHQSIIGVGDDVWFWDDMGIHSIAATEAFGDFKEGFLSKDIASLFTTELNHSRFEFVTGVNFTAAGYALWTVSRSGSSTNNLILGLDYRFSPARFFFWPAYSAATLAIVRDTNREIVPWAGRYTGRMIRMNRPARNVAGTAYTADVVLPYLSFGDPYFDKKLIKGRVSYLPKGTAAFTVGWTRDGTTQQTASITQSGTDTLGASSSQFTLDTSTLGGGRFVPDTFDMDGSFKEVQLQLTQTGLDQEVEPHSLALEIEGAGIGRARPVG